MCGVIVQSIFCNSACIIYWYHISPGLVFRKQLIICLGILRSKVSPYLIELNRQYCVVVYDVFYLRNVIIYICRCFRMEMIIFSQYFWVYVCKIREPTKSEAHLWYFGGIYAAIPSSYCISNPNQ